MLKSTVQLADGGKVFFFCFFCFFSKQIVSLKIRIALLTWHSFSWNKCKLKHFLWKIHTPAQWTKVTLIFSSFLLRGVSLQLTMRLSQDGGNHRFHLLKRLCLTLSNVICGFRGYLHGKEACIVNLPGGSISCPSSYLICMPLLDPQQQLNYQLILRPNEMVQNRTSTSGPSTLISVLKWPNFTVFTNRKGVLALIFIDNRRKLFKIYLSIWLIWHIKLDLLGVILPDDFALETDCLTGQQ